MNQILDKNLNLQQISADVGILPSSILYTANVRKELKKSISSYQVIYIFIYLFLNCSNKFCRSLEGM